MCFFSRIDGDSFAILQTYQHTSELEHVCKQVTTLLLEPFSIGGINQQISVTLGISRLEQTSDTTSQHKIEKIARRLIRQAELATLNAKQVAEEYLFSVKIWILRLKSITY